MTNVFVAGSRRVSHLGADVRRRLDEMIQRELAILVGDANGADRLLAVPALDLCDKEREIRGQVLDLFEIRFRKTCTDCLRECDFVGEPSRACRRRDDGLRDVVIGPRLSIELCDLTE